MDARFWITLVGTDVLYGRLWIRNVVRPSSRAHRAGTRLRIRAISSVITLALVSLGCTISGCALTNQPHSVARAWTFSTAEMTATSQDRELLACTHEPLETGTASIPTHRPEFHFLHPRVTRFVARFQSDSSWATALSRSQLYVHDIATILREEGLPAELAYLPLIESAFRPHAVSRAGAVGLWQLVASTGRHYGLRIDRSVDERRDPVKSTRAAAKYLKDLHATFGDWHLSLAAYNSGEHAIARLLTARPNLTFWELRQSGRLHAETADFVPRFLAAVQIAEGPEAHGFDAVPEEPFRLPGDA
ncbi:MAG TPA: lytic transglycosylase domain-containing protein [Candidatus Margulisiibacteriota bacterium]|nr:lytic transglycosylase domain-containing protein [Candidatus Margulisiibacteriota bacterium]